MHAHAPHACACREYRIPVKGVLNGTAPAALRVVIKPAEATANARAANYSYGVPGLTQPGGLGYYNFLRKPASDFGWDWGPAFTPAGIYGAVELQAYSGAFLTGESSLWIQCCRYLAVPCTAPSVRHFPDHAVGLVVPWAASLGHASV